MMHHLSAGPAGASSPVVPNEDAPRRFGRWPAAYPLPPILLLGLDCRKQLPNIYQPLQAVEVFAVAHSFTETCGFAA